MNIKVLIVEHTPGTILDLAVFFPIDIHSCWLEKNEQFFIELEKKNQIRNKAETENITPGSSIKIVVVTEPVEIEKHLDATFDCVFRRFRPPIPKESAHPFRRKAPTHSEGKRPPIPKESAHLFWGGRLFLGA